jgi:hypothetical protein
LRRGEHSVALDPSRIGPQAMVLRWTDMRRHRGRDVHWHSAAAAGLQAAVTLCPSRVYLLVLTRSGSLHGFDCWSAREYSLT